MLWGRMIRRSSWLLYMSWPRGSKWTLRLSSLLLTALRFIFVKRTKATSEQDNSQTSHKLSTQSASILVLPVWLLITWLHRLTRWGFFTFFPPYRYTYIHTYIHIYVHAYGPTHNQLNPTYLFLWSIESRIYSCACTRRDMVSCSD